MLVTGSDPALTAPFSGVLTATIAMWRQCERAVDRALAAEGTAETMAERRFEAARVHVECGAYEMACDLIDDALSLAPSSSLSGRLQALRQRADAPGRS